MRARLQIAHYFPGDHYLNGDKENGLELGTIVGDGTPYPLQHLTLFMTPLDAEAEKALEEEEARLARKEGSMNPVEQLPTTFEDNYVPGLNVRRPVR